MSVSTIGTRPELDDEALAGAVQRELGAWFGAGEAASWQLLRVYRIPFAQPNQVRQLHALNTSSLIRQSATFTIWRKTTCPL